MQCTGAVYMTGVVYLGDSNPAGTGVRWASRSRSWGSTAAGIARPCRRRPWRSALRDGVWRGETRTLLAAPPSLRAALGAFGAELLPVQQQPHTDGSLVEEELRGGSRPSLAEAGGSVRNLDTVVEFLFGKIH